MEKKKHKLTEEILKQIREIAPTLPAAPLLDKDGNPLFENIDKKIYGRDIPEDAKLNTKIKPNKKYIQRVQKMIMMDHEEQLKGYYEVYGQHGIDEYCKIIRGFVAGVEKQQFIQPNSNLKIVN